MLHESWECPDKVLAINACHLLKQGDAKSIFNSLTMSSRAIGVLPNGHSQCLVTPNGLSKSSLGVDVSWSKKTLGLYRLLYGGHIASVPVTTPTGGTTGATIHVPLFSKLSVAGETAYWLPNPPSTIGSKSYLATYNPNMISEKNGYVVGLRSFYLSEDQDKAALAAILKRL